jgi:hypothetical protein
MKKRFAILIAGALAAVLLAGSAAVSLGLLGARPVTAGSDPSVPKVRTIERTVTIHKKQKPQQGAVVTLAASTPASSIPGGEGYEHEDEDEGYEHEDGGSSASDESHSGGYEDD